MTANQELIYLINLLESNMNQVRIVERAETGELKYTYLTDLPTPRAVQIICYLIRNYLQKKAVRKKKKPQGAASKGDIECLSESVSQAGGPARTDRTYKN